MMFSTMTARPDFVAGDWRRITEVEVSGEFD